MVTLPDFMTRARRELMLSTPDFFFCRAQESTGTLRRRPWQGGTGQPTSGASRWTGWLAVLVVPEHWWVPPTTAKERTLPLPVSPIVLGTAVCSKARGEEEMAGRFSRGRYLA